MLFALLDGTVLLHILGISILTGLIFGLAPALQGSKANLQETLKEGGRSSRSSSHHRFLRGVVVVETSLALILLALGGLMIRSFQMMQEVDPGFRTEGLLTLRTALPGSKYGDEHQRVSFYEQVLERLKSAPGVESASAVSTLPLAGSNSWTAISIEGHPAPGPGEQIVVGFLIVGTDYFGTMGIPLRKGRGFTQQDDDEAPLVAIVNETMARRYWPEVESPLGRRLKPGDADSEDPWLTVVGVAADVRHQNLGASPRPEMYRPLTQNGTSTMTFVVRTENNPLALTDAVRREVWAIDKDQPIYEIRSMDQVVDRRVAGVRATAQVLGVLALVALALATVGIYGVMATSIAERTHEIGVRVALGAQAGDILKLVIGEGMVLVAIGVVVGLAGALGLSKVMSSLLFGVTSTDLTTFATISVLLAGVALVACIIPARGAMRVDPMVTLRYE